MRLIILLALIFIQNNIRAQSEVFNLNWLENIHSKEVEDWIRIENKRTKEMLTKCKKKFRGYSSVNRSSYVSTGYSNPEGIHYYRMMYNELNKPAALYFSKSIGGKNYLIVDPTDISKNDKIDIDQYKESMDGKYLAISYGRNGSDWREIKVKKINGGYLRDVIKNVKFSGIYWFKDGFFYIEYPRDSQFSAEGNPILKYHKLKTDQSEDIVVYKRRSDKLLEISCQVLKGEEYMIFTEDIDDSRIINHYYIDLKSGGFQLKPLLPKLNKKIKVLFNQQEELVFTTDHDYGLNKVNKLSLLDPTSWEILIDQVEGKGLVWAKLVSDKLVCKYRHFLQEDILIYNLNGSLEKSIMFEQGFTVSGFSEGGNNKTTIFYFGNEITPAIVYQIDMITYDSKIVEKTKVTYDIDDYEILYSNYSSFDSTMVPITIIKRKDTKLNEVNPTILKTYGGFGSVYIPSYDPGLIYFLDNGGVYAYAHVRGEGTMGRDWAKAGRGNLKPNTIKDFISAADYLINEKITNSDKLAITGASHGGMVVASSFIKSPGKFRVAVPVVGVYDMLDFENFTVGVFHTDEFGTTSNVQEKEILSSYSPIHNLEKGKNYPACLVVTSENDDRVPPFHSYKFFEKMKYLGYSEDVYLKVEKQSGHYGAYSIDGSIEETADMYSFILSYIKE